jgi:hypothetical protein
VLAARLSVVKFREESVYLHVALAMIGALLIRLFMYPEWEDRYFVPYYGTGLILLLGIESVKFAALRSGNSGGSELSRETNRFDA